MAILLLKAAGLEPSETNRPSAPPPTESAKCEEPDPIDSIESRVYRIRCKMVGGPRSRVLSLAADSEEHARSLAIRDLGSDWTVLEIREA